MLAVSGVTITILLFSAAVLMGLGVWFFFLWAARSGQFKNLNAVADRQLELEKYETIEDYEGNSGDAHGRQGN